VSNAAKYGYPDTEIAVSVIRQDGEARVGVTNAGPGIPAEELPELFTRFYRSRRNREAGPGGLGLGLYISKGLVEAHGGRIWVESVPDQWTTFWFTLPLE
jgi:signal transduction histidine kinase